MNLEEGSYCWLEWFVEEAGWVGGSCCLTLPSLPGWQQAGQDTTTQLLLKTISKTNFKYHPVQYRLK